MSNSQEKDANPWQSVGGHVAAVGAASREIAYLAQSPFIIAKGLGKTAINRVAQTSFVAGQLMAYRQTSNEVRNEHELRNVLLNEPSQPWTVQTLVAEATKLIRLKVVSNPTDPLRQYGKSLHDLVVSGSDAVIAARDAATLSVVPLVAASMAPAAVRAAAIDEMMGQTRAFPQYRQLDTQTIP